MADKINNKEESIARVYQFLNNHKNWQKEADINGNGTIIKTEFRAFILNSSFKFNSGENKEDLIDTFWKSIDINTKGKISGTGTSNNKTLDETEINNVEKTLEATKKIISFMQSKEAPSGIEGDLRTKWKNSVKQGLIFKASEYLKTGSAEDISDEWLNDEFKTSSAKATADYMATSLVNSKLGNIEGYKSGSDEILKGRIDEYVAQLENSTKDEATIINDIEKIVKAYVDTAETNSPASVELLSEYGYDADGSLNPLQTEVLANDLTTKVADDLKANNPELYNEDNEKELKNTINALVKEFLADKSASEFTELKSLDISKIKDLDEYKTFINNLKTELTELQKAKQELTEYVDKVLDQKNEAKTRAVETVIGSSVKTEAQKLINKMKSTSEVSDTKAKLEQMIGDIDAQIEADKAAKEAEEAANREKLKALSTDTTPFILNNKAYSLNSLINSSLRSVTVELSGFEDMSTAITKAMSQIDSISTTIINQLSSVYPTDALQKAFNSIHKYYYAVLNGIGEHGKHDGALEYAVTYQNELTGKTVVENTTVAHGWAYNHGNINDVGDIRDESGCDPTSGVYVGFCNGWGYNIHLDLKQFAEKLASFVS